MFLGIYNQFFTQQVKAIDVLIGTDIIKKVDAAEELATEKFDTTEEGENYAFEEIGSEEIDVTESIDFELELARTESDSELETTQAPPGESDSVDIAQITSVSELSDVEPSDWAFTALQRLIEDYGCLEGYPDRTFRGDRAMTRYEFAAGLNACLDTIFQLTGVADFSDIDRLQEEFAIELEAVRAQTTDLEARVAEIEANQFSTTTKLRGSVFAYLSYAAANGDVLSERAIATNPFAGGRDEAGNPLVQSIESDIQPTFGYLTWLDLTSSFTGQDRLQIQIAAGDATSAANNFTSAGLFNTYGTPFTLSRVINDDEPVVREVFYSFPVGKKLSFTVGPRVNWYRHFDNNRFTFFITGANSFNSSGGTQANAVDRGAGVVAEIDLARWADLRVGYLAENTEFLSGPRSSSDPERGLFGGANTLTGQLGIYPTDDINLRFLYTRSNLEANQFGIVGGAVSEPLYGLADDGQGGPLNNATADTFLFNFDWLVTKGFGLFGRYSYGSTNLNPSTAGREGGDVNAQSIQAGVAFPNLFKPGAQAIISYVQPFEVLDGEEFLIAGGGDGAIQREVEFTYRYPVSPNLAIIPSLYWVMNANNFEDNPDIFFFNLQAQVSF
ncbi:MAG: iron uptake porin [Cyanobacteria bacterium P01_D01_bin.1]